MIEGHAEMIEKIKNTLNLVADLHGWARCIAIGEAVKQLDILKEGIARSEKAHEQAMEGLRQQITRRQIEENQRISGGETYKFSFDDMEKQPRQEPNGGEQ